MNRKLFSIGLVLMTLVTFIMGCRTEHQNKVSKPISSFKYKIDGGFDDWKNYDTIKTDTGIDWANVTITGYEGIHLKEFYVDNDSNYLYLFFKFKPSIQGRHDKTHASGALGCLYIDTDANTNTGCSNFDAQGIPQSETFRSGISTISGSEIQINFPIGIYMNKKTNGCYVSYNVKRWDSAAKSFDQIVRTADSRDYGAMIAHGEDGVEVAILLTNLQVKEGNRLSLAFWEDLVPRTYVKRTTIQLR